MQTNIFERISDRKKLSVPPKLLTGLAFFTALLIGPVQAQGQCRGEATLIINSIGYSGPIDIEFREGRRPGSRVARTGSIITSGRLVFERVCTGTYFFSFSTPDSDQVNVTRYFDAQSNENGHSLSTITVTYTRKSDPGSQSVIKVKKADL
jgi:hypothetical protein